MMKRRNESLLVALLVLAPLALTFMADRLSAQDDIVVPDVGFEIEGNAALDHGGDYDWEAVGFPPALLIQDPNSKAATDPSTFRPNGKFDRTETWSILPSQVGPGQNELTNVMAWAIPPGNLGDGQPADFWLVLGMERTKQNGTFSLDFEFNQTAWDGSSGGPTRTPGDLAVGFELQGNPTDRQRDLEVLIVQYLPGAQPSLCKVTPGVGHVPALVEPGTEPCPPYGDTGWFYRLLADGVLFADSGLGQATMNEDPFSVPDWWLSTDPQGNPRGEIGPFQFAEAALNLTALGYEANCSTFSTVHAKSRASLEVGSDLKDLAGPIPLEVNCRLDGYKFLDIDGNGVWEPDEPPLKDWEIMLSDGRVTQTDEDGYYAFEDLLGGTYTIREECPEDWAQTAPGLTGFDTCGDFVHKAEIGPDHREIHLPDFGNGQPALSLTCTSPSDVFLGDDIEYEISVSNGGNVELRDIKVADSLIGLSETLDLAPGESQTFTGMYSTQDPGRVCGEGDPIYLPLMIRGGGGGSQSVHAVPAPATPRPRRLLLNGITNTATVAGRYALETLTETATCLTAIHDLEVGKDAHTSLTRTYNWAILKTVDDPGPIPLYPGDFAQPIYTVTVGLDAPPFTDSDWAVEGTISVKNPAPVEATIQEVSDVVTGAAVNRPDCGVDFPYKLAAGSTLECSYQADLPDGANRNNTAKATLINNRDGLTTDFCGTAGIDFSQAVVEEIDEEITVTDYFPVHDWIKDLGVVRYDEAPRIFNDTIMITTTRYVSEPITIRNEATYETNDTHTKLTDEASVTIVPLRVTVAYENLPVFTLGDDPRPNTNTCNNDWDYNDLVVDIEIFLDVSPNHDLRTLYFTIAKESAVSNPAVRQELHLKPASLALPCDGTYTIKTGGNVISETVPYTRGDSIPIPSGEPGADPVELRIDFDVPPEGCPFDFGDLDPTAGYHGEGLFFDPWLDVKLPETYSYPCGGRLEYELHAVDPEQCDCRILTIPADWQWPMGDGCHINCVHERVRYDPRVPYSIPDFDPEWWTSDPHCSDPVYPVDYCARCVQCDSSP